MKSIISFSWNSYLRNNTLNWMNVIKTFNDKKKIKFTEDSDQEFEDVELSSSYSPLMEYPEHTKHSHNDFTLK